MIEYDKGSGISLAGRAREALMGKEVGDDDLKKKRGCQSGIYIPSLL